MCVENQGRTPLPPPTPPIPPRTASPDNSKIEK